MLTIFHKRFLTVSASALLMLPLPSFAATRQQILNQALRALNTRVPLHTEGTASVNATSRPVSKDGEAGGGSLKFHFSSRTIVGSNGTHDADARIVLDSLKADTPQFPINLTQPIAFNIRQVNKIAYLRLESLTPELISLVFATSTDLGLVGQWFSIDLGNSSSPTETLPYIGIAEKADNAFKSISSLPILRITRVERTERRADGHVISRLRTRLNTAYVSAIQRYELQQIDPSLPTSWRRLDISDINKRYAELRAWLARTEIVVELDETAGTINRLELGSSRVLPDKKCTYNTRLRRDVCHVASLISVRVLGGVSFLDNNVAPIEAPVQAQPLLQKIMSLVAPTPVANTSDGNASSSEVLP